MLVSFFESFKYVGHQYPIAFLRIFIGYFYLTQGLSHIEGEFLTQPRVASAITEWLPQSGVPEWYAYLLEMFVVPHWQLFAYAITYCEILVAVSFLIGFLVRPVSILGFILVLILSFAGGPDYVQLQKVLMILFVVMFWIGAGRCLGVDYFFYKRQRGLWW